MWTRQLVARWERLRRNPVSHWCALFVVLAATVSMHDNNANPFSRYALLSAVAEDHSLAIDAYRASTCDWSQPPSKRYYSNKAPGAALLALPLYLPADVLVVAKVKDRPTRDARRLEARNAILDYLSVALQAIPFALLVMMTASFLAACGASRAAIELAALAMLFGNTASLLMNMFYGHGMAAVLTLATALALYQGRIALVGLLFGLNVLCDYGSALFLPILLPLVLVLGPRNIGSMSRRLLRFVLGGLGPLVAFAAYHFVCFGGPLTLPGKYQNPVFVEKGARAVWGVIDLLPTWAILSELLTGSKRSLLVTQPWVLVLAALLLVFVFFWRRRPGSERRVAALWVALPLGVGGLVVLLLMNASFGGWHGGVCPGPRYLAAALPMLGLVLGLSYDSFPRLMRILLWLSVLPAIALFLIIWSGDIAIWPQQEIWRRARDVLFAPGPTRMYLRLGWMLLGFVVTVAVAVLRARRRPA